MKTAHITYADLDNQLDGQRVSTTILQTDDPKRYDGVGLLFQTGYLTLAPGNKDSDRHQLKLPNEEVRRALALSALGEEISTSKSNMIAERIRDSIEDARWDALVHAFTLLLGSVAAPNHVSPASLPRELERAYNGKIFMAVRSAVDATNEDPGGSGYADTVIRHNVLGVPSVIIIEYKLSTQDQSMSALRQISDRNYASKYRDKPAFAIAITIDPVAKNISHHQVTQLHSGWES